MGKIKTLIRIAAVVGPTAIKIIKDYGPQIRQLLKENPEFLTRLKSGSRPLDLAVGVGLSTLLIGYLFYANKRLTFMGRPITHKQLNKPRHGVMNSIVSRKRCRYLNT